MTDTATDRSPAPTDSVDTVQRQEGVQRGTTAEDLRRRMAGVRSSLDSDVEQVATSAQDLTDWKYYVKQHPLPLVGAAVAVGYLLVPRKTEVVQPDAKTLSRMAKKQKVYLSNKPQKASKDRSMLDRGLSIAGAFAARAATAYVSQQLGKFTGQTAGDAGPSKSPKA